MRQTFNLVPKQKFGSAVLKEARRIVALLPTIKTKTATIKLSKGVKLKGFEIMFCMYCILFQYDVETNRDIFDPSLSGEITIYMDRLRKMQEKNAQIEAELNRIVGTMKLDGMTDFEKAREIVNKTNELLHYCEEGDKAFPTHTHASTYDIVFNHCVVCDGYARMFCMLCDKAGLYSRYLRNDNHAWNQVKINGQWLYVDCTWDDSWVRVTDWSLKPKKIFYGQLNHPMHNGFDDRCWYFKGV